MTGDPVTAPDRLAAVTRSGLLHDPPAESFDRLASLARRVLGAPVALVTVVDDQRSTWKAAVGVDVPPGTEVHRPLAESFCRHVVSSGEPLAIDDVRHHPLTAGNAAIASTGLAWVGHPVRSPEGHVLGSFCVVDTVPRAWTADDRSVLSTFAQVASTEVALRLASADAVSALAAARAAQRRVALLAAAGELLRAGLDLDTVLATVTAIAVPALGQAALVRTADRHGAVTARAASIHHEDPAWEARLREHGAEAVQALDATVGAGQVLRTGRSRRLVVDPSSVGAAGRGRAAELGLTGVLCVPLRAHGRVFGELQVLSQSSTPYTDEDLALAEELADRAALALDNAVLYTQQREAAVALQQVLLTPAPQPDDLEIAVRYRPATAHAEVGGDWYDAFVRTDGTTLVAIGDVVGHDLHAAAGMGQVRSMLRVLGYQSEGAPADVLAAVDRAVSGLGVATMATAVLAQVEQTPEQAAAGERVLRWSNAGHPPPLLLHAGGEVEVLTAPSDPLIGLGPDFRRSDHEHALPSGSTLVLYTDGLVERRGQHLGEAIGALASTLGGLAGTPLEQLCDALLARTLPGAHEDDVALLALRAHPPGEQG